MENLDLLASEAISPVLGPSISGASITQPSFWLLFWVCPGQRQGGTGSRLVLPARERHCIKWCQASQSASRVLGRGGEEKKESQRQKAEVARQGRGREARPYPLCYYLYGIEKHARSNQHEILNCFAYFCSPHGTDCARCWSCQDPHVSTLSLLHTLFLTSALFCKDAQSFFFSFSPPSQGC